MPETKCPKCGASNAESQYFCRICGTFLREEIISEPEIFESAQFKIMRLIENLKNNYPHEKIIWDDTVDLYAGQIERLKALTVLPEIDSKTLSDEMDVFLSRCRNPEFQIAFVGTIKTGKSTLINALLGKNYASMDVTPETASLTKFRYSKEDYIRVSFFTQKEWKRLWDTLPPNRKEKTAFEKEYERLNAGDVEKEFVGREAILLKVNNNEIQQELLKWSSSKHPEHFFVKEVEVGISTIKDIPSQVVFVDTPGLSDPVGYRSNITRKYIKSANAVFVCIESKKIQSQEIETISSVLSFSSNNKKKVHIVATQWDLLNDPNDWPKLKDLFVRTLTGPGFFDPGDAERNIIYSSALIANYCRDFDPSDKGKRIPLAKFSISMGLDPDTEEIKKNLDRLLEYSNIEELKAIIRRRLVKNYADLLIQDISDKYTKIISMLSDLQKNKERGYQEMIRTCGASLADIEQKLSERIESIKKIKISQDSLKQVSESLNKHANDMLNLIYNKIDEKIEKKNTKKKR